MARTEVMDYKWGMEMRHWLLHHYEVEELVEGFLRYIAANAVVHEFTGFKTMLGIKVHDQYCNVLLQARGLVLKVTRNKESISYLVQSPNDFPGALRWMLSLDDPKGRPMEQVIRTISIEAKEKLTELVQGLKAGHILEGMLRFPSESNTWGIGSNDLDYILWEYIGSEVLLFILPLSEPVASKLCPLCDTVLAGDDCPRCAALAQGTEDGEGHA